MQPPMQSPSPFSPPPYYPGYPPRPSWWSRNWKWVVPVGCFTIVVAMLLILGAMVSLVLGIFGMIKSSGAYEQAMARARSSMEVRQALGEPVEDTWYLTGTVHVNGPSGNANLAIPLHGPKAKGILFVEATKSSNQWKFRVLTLSVDGTGERINLLDSGTI